MTSPSAERCARARARMSIASRFWSRIEPAIGDRVDAVMGAGQRAEDRTGGVGVAAEVDDLDERLLERVGGHEQVEAGGDAGGGEAHRGAFDRPARRRGGWPPRPARPGLGREAVRAATRRARRRKRGSADARPSEATTPAYSEPIRSSSRATSAASRNSKLGSRPCAVDQAADGVDDDGRPGQAPDVAVGHQAGRHHRLEHLLAAVRVEIEADRSDPHRRADPRRVLARLAGRVAAFELARGPCGSSGRLPGAPRRTNPWVSPGPRYNSASRSGSIRRRSSRTSQSARACCVSSEYRPGIRQRYGFFFQARVPSTKSSTWP